MDPNQDLVNFPNPNIEDNHLSPQKVGPAVVEFDRTNYWILNDTAYGTVGVKYAAIDIDISSITGMPGDSLNYLDSYGDYPGDPNYRV